MIELALLGIFVLIMLSALFSGAEAALLSIDKVQVENIKRQKLHGYEALERLFNDKKRMLITILIGNNLVNISLSAVATIFASNLFGSAVVGYVIGIITFLVLVFGEIIPKNFCSVYNQQISLLVARPLSLLITLTRPISGLLLLINHGVFQILRVKEPENITTEDEIKTIVSMGTASGALNKNASEIIHEVLDFNSTIVKEIMSPAKDIFSLDGELSLDSVKDEIVDSGYSRIPIYLKRPDNYMGVLHVSEVMRKLANNAKKIKLKKLNLTPLFIVPETKQVSSLLKEFQNKRTHMAIVVDEYGNVIGLITLEEVLEELVGEIIDETDVDEPLISQVSEKTFLIDGRATLEEISEQTPITLKSDEINTLNGFVLEKLGRVPKTGEKFILGKRRYEVISRSRLQIRKVKVSI